MNEVEQIFGDTVVDVTEQYKNPAFQKLLKARNTGKITQATYVKLCKQANFKPI